MDAAVAEIAAAIGDPSRARMLYCLMDGHARTSTELAIVAEVGASTASVHLNRLREARLVTVFAQGKHRYYSLADRHVAAVLESLNVLAGGPARQFVPNTPSRLRAARTCYDHAAGTLGVALHDRMRAMGWLSKTYEVSPTGEQAFATLGVHLAAAVASRRRFAYACLDWSERRPHLGGALGAAVLAALLKKKWVVQDLDSRALSVTAAGRRDLRARFGVEG